MATSVTATGANRLVRDVPTWGWLTGVLLAILLAVVGDWARAQHTKNAEQDKAIKETQEQMQQRVLAEAALRADMKRMEDKLDRTLRLVVKLATRAGIEVAE